MGVDTSAPQSFTITINAVNDAPSFVSGGQRDRAEDAGHSRWPVGHRDLGGTANESGQTLTFSVSNDNNGLFSVQPAVSPSGGLMLHPGG